MAMNQITKTTYSPQTAPTPGRVLIVLEDGVVYSINYESVDPVDALNSLLDGDESMVDAEPAGELEFKSNDIPLDDNRLNFEVGLLKNKNTSKTAVLLPASTTPVQAQSIARKSRLSVLRQNGEIYLYDPKQITESSLRSLIKSGKNGQPLGYGTDSVPETGIAYAVDLDGNGTVDQDDILQLRDSGNLGFSGKAPDMESAIEKIREMGRDDAIIRGTNDHAPESAPPP